MRVYFLLYGNALISVRGCQIYQLFSRGFFFGKWNFWGPWHSWDQGRTQAFWYWKKWPSYMRWVCIGYFIMFPQNPIGHWITNPPLEGHAREHFGMFSSTIEGTASYDLHWKGTLPFLVYREILGGNFNCKTIKCLTQQHPKRHFITFPPQR